MTALTERLLLGSLAVLGIAGALTLALVGGRPATLPGVALGSPALLYIERATATFTAYVLGLVIVVRAFDGELPSELRGVRYGDGGAKREFERLADVERELRDRLDNVERVVQQNDLT